jgi:hypothetical protein
MLGEYCQQRMGCSSDGSSVCNKHVTCNPTSNKQEHSECANHEIHFNVEQGVHNSHDEAAIQSHVMAQVVRYFGKDGW